jgi:hypothetical protein
MIKKKICIWGGGWAGLTAALELSESDQCEVHLFEATDQWGGKVTGARDLESGTFSTHAIRLISDYYPAFADVCSRVPAGEKGSLLDRWSPVEYFNFSVLRTKGKFHRVSRRKTGALLGALQLYWALRTTFGLKIRDIRNVGKAISRFRSLSEKEIDKLEEEEISVADFFAVGGLRLSPAAEHFLFTYLGITVAARTDSMASMSMDLMSKMFIGVKRSNHLESARHKAFRSWVIDGPMGDRMIPPFVDFLKERNVAMHTNAPIVKLEASVNNKTAVAYLPNGEKVEADAHLLALNNKVIEKLGLGRPGKPLDNDWSIGASVPLEKVPPSLQQFHGKSIIAVMDAPWGVVAVVWYRQKDGGLWSDEVDFSGVADQHMEIVASRLEEKGTNGKTFFECDPLTAAQELLAQIGIEKEWVQKLAPKLRWSDNLKYVQEEAKDGPFLYGPVNPDGHAWRLHAPIYTASEKSPPLDVETSLPGVYRCGEAVRAPYPYIKTPTLELTTETTKAAVQMISDTLDLKLKVNQEYPARFAR